jgi:hypothetical protein
MTTLIDAFPVLARTVSQALRDAGRESLAAQIDAGVIARVTFDPDANAGYIYLELSRALNVVENNIAGVRHGETVPVETPYWTNIDTDNFDRVTGIEILDPRELKQELTRRAIG